MHSSKVENLIAKYLVNEASSEDLDFLSLWITNPENERIFDAYVKIHYEATVVMNQPDVDAIKKNLLKKIQKDKNPFKNTKFLSAIKYAAILAMVFGLGHLYQKSRTAAVPDEVEKSLLVPREDVVTIELGNGLVETLNDKSQKVIKDPKGNVVGKQNLTNLNYKAANNIDYLVYNTLRVPNGKRFDVVLSDGSHVFLNSGTSLKYPVNFLKDQPRAIFLTGEAYFDVVDDKDRPFVVHADAMNVKVLGTKFNVSHYSENDNISTVLVEGSVELFNDGQSDVDKTILKPGFKADWNKTGKDIIVENVDTRVYTAWLDGKLIFRNATFKQIRYALERHYNVTIKNTNTLLDEQRFDATFDIETIDEILETFSKSYAIAYDIVDNEIVIK